MTTKRLEELSIRLDKAGKKSTAGSAVIGKSTLSPEDWDQVVLAGCCTQGCCGRVSRNMF
jgi:hypothetical protein